MAKKLTTIEIDGEISELLVEVPENEPAAWPKEAELAVLGKPLPRVDGPEKVSGRAKYTHDINLPHMLWMKTLRSPHAHARIISIDASKAEALPGVKLVLTHKNTPEIPWYNRRSKLFDTTLRFVGDEVAAVVAADEFTAADALRLLEVEYEELPYVLDPEVALQDDAPLIHEGGNLVGGQPQIYNRGDIEKGLAEADFTVEAVFRSPCQVHACLETHCSVAQWLGGKLTVWDSTQAVHPNRQALATALGIPVADVRVISLYSGGGFGSKLGLNKYTVMASLAARELGRPVKVVCDREEEAHAMGNRPNNVMTLKGGSKRDGALTALYMKNIGAAGAYPAGAGAGGPMQQIYKCPNVKIESYAAHINADVARPHRAPGHVQGAWALEQVIDMLAEKCGLDPLEFRLRNYSEVDPDNGRPYTTKGLREVYQQGAEKFGWATRAARKAEHTRGAKKRGFGMATGLWGGAGGPPGYAIVKMYQDGSAVVYSGCQDIGSATRTSMLQVAAEELGLPPEKVTVVMGDTQGTPYGFVSGGSRTTPSQGPAVRMAAAEVKQQLLELAAKQVNAPAARLATREGYVYDTENPAARKAIAEVTAAALSFPGADREQNMLIGKGWRGPNPDGVSISSWGAQFAEVEVDTDTDEIRVLRIVAAHEVGRVLNPLTGSSQIEGGVIQGMGFALCEERVLNNASGRVVNANLHDYKIPTPKDMPEIDCVLVDLPDAQANSVGIKGLGEPPIVPTPGAIANAVADAIGARVYEAPMTPQRVLEALERAAAPSPPARGRRKGGRRA